MGAIQAFTVFMLASGYHVSIITEAASSSRNVVECLKVGPKIEVTLSQFDEEGSYDNGLGIVSGVKSCGGPGELYQMRYETCSSEESQEICKVPGDNILRRAEIHFSPSQDIESLAIRLLVSTKGIPPTEIFDKGLENSLVVKGEKYVINADVGASQMFKGRKVKMQFELYREGDRVVEICSAAEVEIV